MTEIRVVRFSKRMTDKVRLNGLRTKFEKNHCEGLDRCRQKVLTMELPQWRKQEENSEFPWVLQGSIGKG